MCTWDGSTVLRTCREQCNETLHRCFFRGCRTGFAHVKVWTPRLLLCCCARKNCTILPNVCILLSVADFIHFMGKRLRSYSWPFIRFSAYTGVVGTHLVGLNLPFSQISIKSTLTSNSPAIVKCWSLFYGMDVADFFTLKSLELYSYSHSTLLTALSDLTFCVLDF